MSKGTGAGDSKFFNGGLLRTVAYPDSSGSTDVVTHAHNADGQEIWRKDETGTVLQSDFDTGGTRTHRRVTTLASGFDGAVRRIWTTYDSSGRASLIYSHDNASVGSGAVVNEVKEEYDGWGNLPSFCGRIRDAPRLESRTSGRADALLWTATEASLHDSTVVRTASALEPFDRYRPFAPFRVDNAVLSAQSVLIGAASNPSPRLNDDGPVCRTTPPTKRLPRRSRSQAMCLAAWASGAASAFTSKAMIEPAPNSAMMSISCRPCNESRFHASWTPAFPQSPSDVACPPPALPRSACVAEARAISARVLLAPACRTSPPP